MKKKFRVLRGVLQLVIFILMVMFKSSYSFAMENYQRVQATKEWIVKFNQQIDVYSIYKGNIQVEDFRGNIVKDIKIVLCENGCNVKIKPPNKGYDINKLYTLVISNKVRSLKGKYLKKEIKKRFLISDIFDDDIDEDDEIKHSIMGKQELTAEKMAKFVLIHNPEPKINIDIHMLANIFLEEGKKEGVRGDIAFCQSIKETGFFKYGGQVLPEQNNYAGIGAINDSPIGKGAWFKEEREGVRAQIQHLKGYATDKELNGICVDPRYFILKKVKLLGTSPNWEELNGKWAIPGKNYGQEIIKIYKKIENIVD